MQEIRTLSGEDLRTLCIEKGWYTQGSEGEYRHLLCKADNCSVENITTAVIVELARDILDHSDTAYTLSEVCTGIAGICHALFVDDDD